VGRHSHARDGFPPPLLFLSPRVQQSIRERFVPASLPEALNCPNKQLPSRQEPEPVSTVPLPSARPDLTALPVPRTPAWPPLFCPPFRLSSPPFALPVIRLAAKALRMTLALMPVPVPLAIRHVGWWWPLLPHWRPPASALHLRFYKLQDTHRHRRFIAVDPLPLTSHPDTAALPQLLPRQQAQL